MAKIPGLIFPVDPTIPADAPDYRYEVIVTVRCGDRSYDTPHIIETDDRITAAEAIDQSIAAVRQEAGSDSRTSPIPDGIELAPCIWSARVISVGRRSGVPAIPPRK